MKPVQTTGPSNLRPGLIRRGRGRRRVDRKEGQMDSLRVLGGLCGSRVAQINALLMPPPEVGDRVSGVGSLVLSMDEGAPSRSESPSPERRVPNPVKWAIQARTAPLVRVTTHSLTASLHRARARKRARKRELRERGQTERMGGNVQLSTFNLAGVGGGYADTNWIRSIWCSMYSRRSICSSSFSRRIRSAAVGRSDSMARIRRCWRPESWRSVGRS